MFPTTQWTLLAEATRSGDAAGRAALGEMCQAYRGPVAGFLRSRGHAEADAEDLAQEFFRSLVESRAWKRADRARGRFRTFLLGALWHVEHHAWSRQQRQKRGGGAVMESLDEWAEGGMELAAEEAADASAFDREWALALVARAVAAVETEFSAAGMAARFAVLRRFLPGAWSAPSYEEAAAETGLSLTALKSAVLRLRGRFREQLRAAVAATVAGPHEVDEELDYLRRILTHAL